MEGLLKYFIECLHFHFYLFAHKKQNVTCGRPFNRQKTTEICHFFVSTFWCLQLDKPTLGARGFFRFCFVLDRGFAAHCRRKTKQKNPLAPRVGYTRKDAQVHADMRLVSDIVPSPKNASFHGNRNLLKSMKFREMFVCPDL